MQSFDAATQQLLKTALKGEHAEPPEPGPRATEEGPRGQAWSTEPSPGFAQPSPFTFSE